MIRFTRPRRASFERPRRAHSRTARNIRHASLATLALTALAVATVPAAIGQTVASWNDSEWAHAETVGTSSFDCGTDENYTTTSAGKFLSGSLLGVNLDNVANLRGIRTERTPGQPVVVDPPNAINLNSPDPRFSTYANPLAVSALSGVVGLDLTGLNVGLPAGSAGAVNQYSKSSVVGQSAGASGLVNNSGAVGVTPTTPGDQLPQPAVLKLSNVLPAIANVSDVGLRIGAVAASSELDWCAALESEEWGDGSVTGVTRDYGIASMDLTINSPLVGSLVTNVNSTITALNTAVTALQGVNGGIANLVRARIAANISNLLGATVTGNVTISNLNLTGAVQNLLTTPLTDGTVTINLSAGTISVNLAKLLGDGANGLNDLPPNTELLLNTAVLNPLVTRVGNLLNAWTSQVTTAINTALDNATVTIALTAVVKILGGIDLVKLTIGTTASIASIRAGSAVITVVPELLGVIGTLNLALSLLGLPTVTAIITTLTAALTTGLLPPLTTLLTTNLFSLVTTLGTTLSTVVNQVLTAVGAVYNALPSVLSLAVNAQPDQPNPLPGSSYDPGNPPLASPEYKVSALRIGLIDLVSPANGFIYLSLATASAGSNKVIP